MDKLDLSTGMEGKTFVVQGLGNVGYHSSLYMTQAGAKLVGVAEMEGTIYDPKGIDLKALWWTIARKLVVLLDLVTLK